MTAHSANSSQSPHVVIVGGGFGGLYAAKQLGNSPCQVTLVDRRNFHLFQPLLYQVATGNLSPGDIGSPLRGVLEKFPNIHVAMAEVTDIDVENHQLIFSDGTLHYDILILATGSTHHYFGNDHWAEVAPGMKSIEDALDVRRRVFLAFESAEREQEKEKYAALMNFVIVGGGPTGVELAGALGELAHQTLKNHFRSMDPCQVKIHLIEGASRILPIYSEELSEKAQKDLEHLGVTVRTNTFLKEINGHELVLETNGTRETLQSCTILWAAGVKASGLGKILSEKTGAELDRIGRVIVNKDLSVPEHPDIFIIGDLAHYAHQDGKPLPGVAPVAMQQGDYMAKLIRKRLQGQKLPPFNYVDRGSMAVIGRNRAVAELHGQKLSGFLAWWIWSLIHIRYLVEFDNQLLVMMQWCWNYFTRKRGACLITGDDPYPLTLKSNR